MDEQEDEPAAPKASAPIHYLSASTITPGMTTQKSPDQSPEEYHYDGEDEHDPDHEPLRQLRTSHSVSSISSTSSSTTNQTFLSTLSFSTTTGHLRTQTQDELLSSSSAYPLRSVPWGYDDKGPQEEDDFDIDSLDVAILTPKDSNRPNPFDGAIFNTRHGQQPPQLYDPHDGNTSSSSSSNSQVYASSARKGHTKSSSQRSSGVATIKGGVMGAPSDQYSPERPASLNGRHSLEKSMDDQHVAVQPEEGMQFTSPDYRKSMVASIHSDDIAMDFSNGASPISGRGSFFNPDHQRHQYGSLLKEAASIIEQQSQSKQGRVIGTSRTSLNGVASPTRATNESGYQAIAAMAPSRPNSGRTVYRTVQEVPPTQSPPPQPLPPTEEAPVSEAPTSSAKSVASKNTPGSSSNRSTLTRSRSRRFSAHGNHFSSQTSLSSLSKESTVSAKSVSARGRGDEEDDEGYPISNSNNKPKNEKSGGNSLDGSLHMHHSLQRFPTAHPQLGYDDYASHNYALAPLPITPSSNAHNYQHYNNQPRHYHDYRPGVVFEYYEGEWDWLPNFDEMQPQHVGIVGNFMIDEATERELFRPRFPRMHRGGGGPGGSHVASRHETGNYAVRFTTNIDITQDGVYSFWVSSNDGSVLYIANTLVVENDGMHYATEVEGRILLSAGKHPMTVEFFHRNGKMLEGFRSTGPSLVVSYRAPGPVWSFGLGAGPKQTMKSDRFFYDHGDGRLMGLLNEYGVFDEYAPEAGRNEAPESRAQDVGKVKGKAALWSQGAKDGPSSHAGGDSAARHDWRGGQGARPTRHRVMSGDMAQLQPSARELQVQMENAKTTIKDLEQIIRDQSESHRNKMNQLYEILQDTQDQVDRLVSGLQKATLFENPQTMIVQNRHSNNVHGSSNKTGPDLPSALINRGHFSRLNNFNSIGSNWRSTVVSVYVDAEEEHQDEEDGTESDTEDGEDKATNGDEVLKKHLADLEKLKQMYFFSMALSVKMNSEMMGKKTVEYTSTSVQKLYEDCTVQNKVPVEGWPGFVSRYFAAMPGVGSVGLGGGRPPEGGGLSAAKGPR